MSEKLAVLAMLGAWAITLLAAMLCAALLILIEAWVGYQKSSLLLRILLTGLVGTWVMSKVRP